MDADELIAIHLTDAEWGQVMTHLSQGIWHIVNPVIVKIHGQLTAREGLAPAPPPDGRDPAAPEASGRRQHDRSVDQPGARK